MRLPESLCANGRLKSLSLLLAVVLWLFVTLESPDEIEMPVVLTVVNIPPGLTLRAVPSTAVSLRVAGPRTLLLRQKWQGARLELDLGGAVAGWTRFSELESRVRLIPGVHPIGVVPRNLELHLTQQ